MGKGGGWEDWGVTEKEDAGTQARLEKESEKRLPEDKKGGRAPKRSASLEEYDKEAMK